MNEVLPMPLAACPNRELKDVVGLLPPQRLAGEIECICPTERVSQALRRAGHSAMREVGVSVQDGIVFLEGRVASYYQKQLSQEAVRQVFSRAIIRNELEITL